ncbi:SDR family NAD(P)-dependent oxidoreductase [Konateibacter massiliensis]|uniref:SDR family NAD(P)-dependent oxidoreductase n=1 Tax=Konateibacter massiliensis TaxID=2002841 RepID=UPI001F3E1E5E|nr:SDR family NAD(P)-dependent oxidoreductase [Konateibacter massiliensis]
MAEMKIAVVTGASSGLGREFVKQLDKKDDIEEIWVIARREKRLKSLKEKTKKPVKIIAMDLSAEEQIEELRGLLKAENPDIRVLVNSAGYGIRKDFAEAAYEEEVGMVEINCKSLTKLTYLCIPYMREGSRILQIASAAAFLPQAGFAVYSASKAYVLSFSRALNRELKERKITVTAVCPGPVDTEFFAISDAGGKMPAYKTLFLAKSDQVVKKALKDSARKRSISIYGISIRLLRLMARFL